MRGSRRRVAALLLLPLALLLSGCAVNEASPPVSSPASPAPSAAEGRSGADLVGLWKVTGSPWKETWAVFDARSFTVERDGDTVFGSLRTSGGRILASVTGWHGADNRDVPWLTSAYSFTSSGRDRLLLAADGSTLATLVPARSAPDPKDALPEVMDAPTLSAEDDALLGAPTPAPSPGPAIDAADLVGRWTAGSLARKPPIPSLTLHADGSYASWDGCAGIRGAWRLLPHNRLLATDGVETSPACDAIDVPGWVVSARSVSIDGDRLTLFDAHGTALGSLRRG